MRKGGRLIFPIKNKLLIFGELLLLLLITATACVKIPTTPAGFPPAGKNRLSFQTLLKRLSTPEEPLSREGTGLLIIQSPGEMYRLSFRLIARGPEALRLEIFDLFGRPVLYLFSYLGDTHLFSISDRKEIPFNHQFSGPLALFSQMPFTEISKIFWGRIPLFPYDSYQVTSETEEGQETDRIVLKGVVQEELWITMNPLALIKARIKFPSNTENLEATFSHFSSSTGRRIPMQCILTEGSGENAMTIRYETLVPRPDIPDEVFELPKLPKAESDEKDKNLDP
jgi:hypothetical protein